VGVGQDGAPRLEVPIGQLKLVLSLGASLDWLFGGVLKSRRCLDASCPRPRARDHGWTFFDALHTESDGRGGAGTRPKGQQFLAAMLPSSTALKSGLVHHAGRFFYSLQLQVEG